jgi:hypothetical protein
MLAIAVRPHHAAMLAIAARPHHAALTAPPDADA